jgi:hypothetical protein
MQWRILPLGRSFPRDDLQLEFVLSAEDGHGYHSPDEPFGQKTVEVIHTGNGLIVYREDEISLLHSCPPRRSLRVYGDHFYRLFFGQFLEPDQTAIQ